MTVLLKNFFDASYVDCEILISPLRPDNFF